MSRCTSGILLAFVAISLLTMTGCRPMSTDYGKSKGTSGKTSLNGFGALRRSYVNAGYRSRDVSRLTDRVLQTDVIVWTPQTLTTVNSQVTRWFDRWLSRGDRTLVYIVPDSGSAVDYWTDASKLAPPPQRLEYRRRAARSINERMLWRTNRSSVQSNGWFRIEPRIVRKPIGELGGPWKEGFEELSPRESEIGIEFDIVAYDPNSSKATAPVFNPGNFGPTGPGSQPWSFPGETTPTNTKTGFGTVLESDSGSPIVAEIKAKKWGNSRILVVAGGSLLTNYAFTRPFNRKLADRIIQESNPGRVTNPTAGFLTSNWNQIPVSERQAGAPVATGMELLTVWPISMVTMHGIMLGVVICLMLLPIFGRPRRLRNKQQSEFAHHLDAVAALMNKSGGERYARARISEYFKRMHGESTGPWVLPDPKPQPPPPKPAGSHTLKPKNLSTRRPGEPREDNADTVKVANQTAANQAATTGADSGGAVADTAPPDNETTRSSTPSSDEAER
ncbi:MAG: hypothetical protein AAGI63_03315 [Planctomycetota bacterium]